MNSPVSCGGLLPDGETAAAGTGRPPALQRPSPRKTAPAGEVARTAAAQAQVRRGTDEKTGEVLTAATVTERIGWCAALVQGMAARLVEEHWDGLSLRAVSPMGADEAGRPPPAQAYVALRRLGWVAVPPDAVKVYERATRMAEELAGRILRMAWQPECLIRAITSTWPADPEKRTPQEWDAVRAAMPGGKDLPSSHIRARTRQVARHDQLEPLAVTTPYVPAARDRSKTGPTPRRSDSRRAPRRRTAPSPPRPARGGQRPEGHAHTAQILPRAATRDQRVNATCTAPRRPHRARGAALGAGFHLHAHATPPRWATPQTPPDTG